jgi:GT2 family glycosyltransferase
LGVDAVFVGFCDDDIIFETDCIKRMWEALRGDGKLGGVNATITNQGYHSPGRATRLVLRMMHSRHEPTYAGRVIGPAVNLLPEDRSDLPEVVPVDWLNTTCTMYRREALPVPPFDSCFSGYSMLEDLALSLRVSRRWRLANVRTARIYHDSQPGPQKSDPRIVAEMELRNRHYIMREILGRNRIADHARLALWETFQLAALVARPSGLGELPKVMAGKIAALRHIFSNNGAF